MSIINSAANQWINYFRDFGHVRVDVVNENLTYLGWSRHGSLTSEPVWHIGRIYKQGNETVTDYKENGRFDQIWDNRAGLFSAPPWTNGLCTVFDGVNDYVTMGNNLSKERTDTFTISAWVRFNNILSTQTIFSKKAAGGQGLQAWLDSSGRLNFSLTNTTTINQLHVRTTGSLTENSWYNITITYEGTSSPAGVIVYLNGNIAPLTTVANSLSATILTATAALFGQFNSGQFLSGRMDEVTFWSKALATSEVIDLYNLGNPNNPANHSASVSLTNYWRCGDSDTFPTWIDSAGAIDGTMTNMLATNFSSGFP